MDAIEIDEVQRESEVGALATERAQAACAELRARLAGLNARIERLASEVGGGWVEGQWMGMPRAARERARRLEALNDMLSVAMAASQRIAA